MASVTFFAGDGGIVENLAQRSCEAEEPMKGELFAPTSVARARSGARALQISTDGHHPKPLVLMTSRVWAIYHLEYQNKSLVPMLYSEMKENTAGSEKINPIFLFKIIL